MPAFYILVVLAAGLLWLLLSIAYRPIGVVFNRLFDDAIEEMAATDVPRGSEAEDSNENENEIERVYDNVL